MGSIRRAVMECTGKYRLQTSENFEDFMKVLGVGLVTRKLGNAASPTVTITKEGEEYAFKQESFKTSEFKFKVGEPFEEITADGRKVMSTMTQLGPNVMQHEMKGTDGGKDSVCVREFLRFMFGFSVRRKTCYCCITDDTSALLETFLQIIKHLQSTTSFQKVFSERLQLVERESKTWETILRK